MRVPLSGGLGVLELIDEAEPDWRYTAVCQNPDAVARLAFMNDRSPEAARVRAMVASTLTSTPALRASSNSGVLRALEGALSSGAIRLTSGRTAPLQRLAPYTPPPKPAKEADQSPRVAKKSNAEPPPPEEATVAEPQGECMKEAAEDGAPLVEQAE